MRKPGRDRRPRVDCTCRETSASRVLIASAEVTMPRGVLGLNATMVKEYLRFIANRRRRQIGVDPVVDKADGPFPWMAETIDRKKEKNFFAVRVTEYQTGGALNRE